MEKSHLFQGSRLSEVRTGLSRLLSYCSFTAIATPWTHKLRYPEDIRDYRQVIAFQSVGAIGMLLAGVLAPKRSDSEVVEQASCEPRTHEHQLPEVLVTQNGGAPCMTVASAERMTALLQRALDRPVETANTTTPAPIDLSEIVSLTKLAVDSAPAVDYS